MIERTEGRRQGQLMGCIQCCLINQTVLPIIAIHSEANYIWTYFSGCLCGWSFSGPKCFVLFILLFRDPSFKVCLVILGCGYFTNPTNNQRSRPSSNIIVFNIRDRQGTCRFFSYVIVLGYCLANITQHGYSGTTTVNNVSLDALPHTHTQFPL